MKRFLLFLICGMVSSSLFAQQNISKSGWYIQGHIGANTTRTETLGMFKNGGLSIGGEMGYNFNPYIGFGIQAQYNYLTIKDTNDDNNKGFNSIEPSLNFYWDLTNTILGFTPDRMNHLRLYGGFALAFTSALPGGRYVGDKTDNASVIGFRAGIQYERNLGNRWAFVADGSLNSFNGKFEGKTGGSSLDSHLNLMVGIRRYFTLGSTRKVTTLYQKTVINYITDSVKVYKNEIKTESAPNDVYSIFFDINKIDIRNSEVLKIQTLANYLKANPNKVVFVFGYADKNTGTAQRNEWLAKNRARVICEELVNIFGINPSRIISTDQGDKVQPFSEDEFEKNRSTICVVTDLVR